VTPQQLRDAAELIEQLNARDNLPLDAPISPSYLRSQAAQMEQAPKTVAEQLDAARTGEDQEQS
jgi:hypothetical protein